MTIKTADLCDEHEHELQVSEPVFRHFGGKRAFAGRIVTVKVHEDNKLVRSELEKNGAGNVLIIDGGGSLRSALVGDKIAQLAVDNEWQGLIVYGCIRDSAQMSDIALGVVALASNPVRPKKNGFGEVGIAVRFAGVTFNPGHYVYADEDGMVVSARKLD
jgi:regulator of ribonuclease activity A